MRNYLNMLKLGMVLMGVSISLIACQPSVTGPVPPPVEPEQIEENREIKSDDSTQEAVANSFTPSKLKDIAQIKDMHLWLEYFYYNNIFDSNVNNESGEISEDAMISFAASHIMQLEHKGLRFDTDTFRLYIPQKVLEEAVLRFFNHQIENHHSVIDQGILFEEDNYVIEANAREWPTRLDIILVTETAPKVYTAVLNGNNIEAGEIDHQIKAEFQRLDDRYILKKYQVISDKDQFISGNPIDLGNSGDEPGTESSRNYEKDGNGEVEPENPDQTEGENQGGVDGQLPLAGENQAQDHNQETKEGSDSQGQASQ